MMLLRLISWPYFRKHVLRTLLTVAGIVLGVAVFVGMHTANQSVLFAFNSTVDRIAGKTELQVTAGETGFDEEMLERVQAAPSVRVAVPVIEAVVDSQIAGEGSLLILGVDMTGDRSLRDYDLESGDEAVIDDPLVFLAQPDSIILTSEFADEERPRREQPDPARHGVRRAALHRARHHEVVGAVERVRRQPRDHGHLRRAEDVRPRPDVRSHRHRRRSRDAPSSRRRRTLRALLGPGFQVDPPSGRGQQFEAMTAAYSMMVSISSLFALFIGMFIIYNSFAIAVTQRRSEIGILRALGATRGQIRRLFLAESAVTGLIGSLAGLAFGLLIARGIAASIGDLISDVVRRGAARRRDCHQPGPAGARAAHRRRDQRRRRLDSGAAGGARRSGAGAAEGQVSGPVGGREPHARRRSRRILAAVSLACLFAGDSRVAFYLGYVLAIVVALLLGPLLSLALARMLRPVLKWIRPVEGALAADSLIQAPRRTSASVAALMLSLALVVAFAGMARASYTSIIDWMDTALNPDLFVMPSQDIVIRTLRFPPTMAAEVEAIPGVERVQMVRNARVVFRGTPIMIVATDIASIAETASRPPVYGDAERRCTG